MKAELEFKQGNWQGPYMTMMGAGAADPRSAPGPARRRNGAGRASRPTDALAAIRLWRELAPQSDEATQYYLGFVVLSDNLGDAEAIFRSSAWPSATPGRARAC